MKRIGYDSTIILYTRSGGEELDEECYWIGTKLSGVRVELNTGMGRSKDGTESTAGLRIFISAEDLPFPVVTQKEWADRHRLHSDCLVFSKDSYILVVDHPGFVHVCDAPYGRISDDRYIEDFVRRVEQRFGKLYRICSAEYFRLIPHWEIEAR